MVDLNTANIEQLAVLPGVGALRAYDLIVWRPFLYWEEVEAVPGFDAERVEGLKEAGAQIALPGRTDWPPETGLFRPFR
jgi:DNA uptake protein ComE-like DNA-binding protein